MAGTGMQHDEHLVLLTGLNALAKIFQQDGIIVDILARIFLAQGFVGQILTDVDGRLAPVRGTP